MGKKIRTQKEFFLDALRVVIDRFEQSKIDSFKLENHVRELPDEEGYLVCKPSGWTTVHIVFGPKGKK